MDMVFDDYSKISDDVMMIGSNTILKMNVSLQYTDTNNMKKSFHREVNSYDENGRIRASIKRTFDYFLSIENLKPVGDNREFIRIGIPELYRLKNVIPHVIDWFTSPDYVGLFALNANRELYLDKQVDSILLDKLPMGKFLSFEPVVINYDTRSLEGVRMYINSDVNYVDIPYETRFIGFADMLMGFNLYIAAQGLLNYFGRPEFGTNSITIGSKFN